MDHSGGDTPQSITALEPRSGNRFITVVPSDTAALVIVPAGLYALTVVSLVLKGSYGVASSGIQVVTLPFALTFVMVTGTTATVVALV